MLLKRFLVIIFSIWIPLSWWVIDLLGLPPELKYLHEVLVFMLLPVAIARLRKKHLPPMLLKYFAVFLSLALLSALWNNIDAVRLLFGAGQLLLGLSVALIIVGFEVGEQEVMLFLKISLLVNLLFQTPLAFWQFYTNIGAAGAVDSVVGTFGKGTANLFGIYCLMLAIVSFIVIKRKSIKLLFSLDFIVLMVLSSSRTAWVLLIVVLLYYSFAIGRFAPRRVVLFAVGSLVLLAAYYRFATAGLSDVTFVSNIINGVRGSFLESRYISHVGVGRIGLWLALFRVMDWKSFFIGFGPGALASNSLVGLAPSRALGLIQNYFGTNERFFPSQVFQSFGEFGILGISLYLLLLFKMFGKTRGLIAANGGRSRYPDRLGLIANLFALVFMIAPLGEIVWSWPMTTYLFWIVGGCVVGGRIRNYKKNESIT